MIQSTKLAKAVYWLSGQVSRIRTPQRRWGMNPNSDDMTNMFTRLPGLTWSSCRWTWKILGWAQRLDRKHFDHWALDHEGHANTPCPDCKGEICALPEEEYDDE